MPLNVISERILDDARAESERIARETGKTVTGIRSQEEVRRQAETKKTMAQGREEIERFKKERLATAGLRARDELIATKQRLIDEAFAKAETILDDIDNDEYVSLMAGFIAKNAVGGEDIVLDTRYGALNKQIIKEANTSIKEAKREPVRPAGDARPIGRGVILRRGKIEINCVFARLIKEAREELETDIADLIFKET